MSASPNLKPSYTLWSSCTSWSLIACSTHSPFTRQTWGIPNHGVRDTNWIQLSVPKHVPTFNLINPNIIPQKDIIIPYMTQTCYLLNSQIFVKFFFFVTMPETLHYTEFITKYCPKYVRLIFSLYFMTKILFWTSLLPLPTPFSLIQPIPSATQPLSLPTSSLLFSSHSLHLPSLYPKPASEKDPQEFTNIA